VAPSDSEGENEGEPAKEVKEVNGHGGGISKLVVRDT
jgi:hypothetical protein